MDGRTSRIVLQLLLAAVVAVAAGGAGCAPSGPAPTPPLVPPDPRPPAADQARMRYDPTTRAIRLYDLPDGGRWWLV